MGGREASARVMRVTSTKSVCEENNQSFSGQIIQARALPVSRVNSI
jgi:hypothetical protein